MDNPVKPARSTADGYVITGFGSTYSAGPFVALALTTVISTIAVILRFWCKINLKSGIHADDWWILATLLSFSCAQSAVLWGVLKGISDIAGTTFLESLFIFFSITLFTLYSAKISVCLLYRRIFSIPNYRTLSNIAMCVATAWFVAALIVDLLICTPVDSFWDLPLSQRCLNFDLFYLLIGCFETVIDILILVLPIRAVSNLNLSFKTKFIVSCIFMLGGITVITNIIRLYRGYQPKSEEYVSFGPTVLWTQIHIAAVILCGCLPVYKPVLMKLGSVMSRLREWCHISIQVLRSGQTKSGDASASSLDYGGSTYPMVRLPSSDKRRYVQNRFLSQESHVALVSGPGGVATHIFSARADGSSQSISIPRDAILRTRDIEVV